MPITFDGANRIITLESGVTSVAVSEIYSRWKDWVLQGDNSKYFPAFFESGGEPIGGGTSTAVNIFLRNDLGWRIKPPEEDITITIVGNLFPFDPGLPYLLPTEGSFTALFRTVVSANALQVSGAGASAEIWDVLLAEHDEPGTFGERISKLLTVAKFIGLK